MADATTHTDHTGERSGRGLRAFDLLLSCLTIGLTAGTALLAPLLVLQSFGHGTVSVDGVVDVPYTFAVDGGPQVEVDATGSTSTAWDGPGEIPYEGMHPTPGLRTTIDLDDDDVDARMIAGVGLVLFLVAAWVGLLSLRRVVRSALAGQPFDARNVARLRWCAAAVLSAPVGGWITAGLLEATIDSGPPGAHVSVGAQDWGVYTLVGLGLLALAEVFRRGATLQELEESTI